MAVAFERGRLACEMGGDGRGLTGWQAVAVARDLRAEFPNALVVILRARPCWEGGWPWNTEGRR